MCSLPAVCGAEGGAGWWWQAWQGRRQVVSEGLYGTAGPGGEGCRKCGLRRVCRACGTVGCSSGVKPETTSATGVKPRWLLCFCAGSCCCWSLLPLCVSSSRAGLAKCVWHAVLDWTGVWSCIRRNGSGVMMQGFLRWSYRVITAAENSCVPRSVNGV